MNEKDLRVIKTKRALSQSLYELLEKQPFSTISVNQICNEALVHRTTFYKHFYDKYDLLIYLTTDLTQDYFSTDLKERINNPFTILNKSKKNGRKSGRKKNVSKRKTIIPNRNITR